MGQQRIKDDRPKQKPQKGVKKEKEVKTPKPEPEKKRIRQIIRLVETNLDGEKPVKVAIRSIRGVSFMFSNAIVSVSGFDGKKLGDLSEQEMKRLEDIILNPAKYNIPAWLYNRKREPETGENKHLTVSRLELAHKMNINEMKKLRTYKGIRHQLGLPVRGQRTRSSFRKGGIVGVKKEEAKAKAREAAKARESI